MEYMNKYIKRYWKPFITAIFFLTIEAVSDLLQPTIMAKIVDVGVVNRDMEYVLHMGMIMLLVTAFGAVGAITRNIVSSNVSQKFGSELRSDLFRKIQTLSLDKINQFETASLITRLTNDVTQVQNFAHRMMRIFVKAPILCVGGLIMATILSPKMAIVLAIVVPIVALLIALNMKVGYPYYKKVQKSLDKVNGVLREYLEGIRVVKAFNRFFFETNRFENANQDYTDISMKALRLTAIFSPAITFVVNLGIIAVLWFGGISVDNGNLEVGKIIAFINYMTQILFSLMMISMVFNMFVRARASVERIGEVFKQKNDMVEKEFDSNIYKDIKGQVDFEGVYFSYKGYSSEPILKNINLSFLPGETIGIIGPTGSGKSSLVSLIPRFHDTSSGVVRVDDLDVKELNPKQLREKIAIVPQETKLFTGTILENIRWGNKNATLEEVESVAKIAQVHDFISSMTSGYNTVLGQGGVNLSGGQKQRVSIARALIKRPEILILDDSTSALDITTETKIRNDLKEYSKNLTCIIIAQRITSVMGCDKVVVLEDGEVVGLGTHDKLIEECDIYKDIYHSQIGKEAM
ncbi:MAG: ABC transporter ATP-binding protein [Firmicutes bacterium]|nr:ABC transporter ATP-binding protein [Bacillota bacterium]